MGALGVVVNEPAAQIYLRRLNGLVEGFPQGGLEEPYELPQRAFYGLH